MAFNEDSLDELEYVVLVLQRASDQVLVTDGGKGYQLPRVRIRPRARPAEQLQQVMKETWGASIFVLDFLPSGDDCPSYVAVEILEYDSQCSLVPTLLDDINEEISLEQRVHLDRLLSNCSTNTFMRVGWLDDCAQWVESTTGHRVLFPNRVQQYNAGAHCALLRFRLENHSHCWVKATGGQNQQEPHVTRALSHLGGGFVPEFVAFNQAWNAWLMFEEARSIDDLSCEGTLQFSVFQAAAHALAQLQINTQHHGQSLMQSGAFDQRLTTIWKNLTDFVDYLDEAMSLQTVTHVPRLPRARILEIRQTLDRAIDRIQELRLPDAIVHGDLNRGNILFADGLCQFIDWSEAYVGHPFVCMQHLLLLNDTCKSELHAFIDHSIRTTYRNAWSLSIDPELLDEGLLYMPLMALLSALYGRGTQFQTGARRGREHQSYVRSLTRRLDRAAREPLLAERLCG